MQVRKTLVRIHIWLGLTIGALWALQGLTGALLVFNRDLQPWLLRQERVESAAPLPLDTIFARAAVAAGAPVRKLEAFSPDPGLLIGYFEDDAGKTRSLVIDSHSGRILDRRGPDALLPQGGASWRWLLRVHEALLVEPGGKLFVGTSGLVLLLSLALGIYAAWPRRGQWRAVFAAARWRTYLQRLFGWHRMIGVAAVSGLVVMTLLGSFLAFGDTLRPLMIDAGIARAPYHAAPAKQVVARISAQHALDAARGSFPTARLMRATLPTPKSPVFLFRLLQRSEWRRWAGTTTVVVDPADGRVLDVYDPLHAPIGNWLLDNAYPLHNADVAGLPGRVLICLLGLAMPVLYVTGILAWLRKRRLKRRRAAG